MNKKEGKNMRVAKKISSVLLALCLLVPCFSMTAYAADGKISFSDPETKVGEVVEVKCAVRLTSGSLGDVEVNLNFDSDALSFESGDGAESSEDGSVTCIGNGGSSEQIFMLNFEALKEGSTKITVSDAAVSSADGSELTLDEGNSTVKISKGKSSKGKKKKSGGAANDMQVEIDGTAYMLTDDFPEGDVPDGYERMMVTLDGQERQMVVNANSGVTLAYLLNGDKGDFFLYNEEDATFAPYEELVISDKTSIILLSDTSAVNLSSDYKEAELTLDDKTFPVWQKSGEEGIYVLYAMNSNGEKDYYRYDAEENTYQKFTPESGGEKKEEASGLLGKAENFIGKNIQKIVFFGGLGLLVIIVLILVLGIKLHNRNAELDELYEEYGLNDEEPQPVKEKKNGKGKEKGPMKPAKGKGRKKDEFDEDDFEDDFATGNMDFTEDIGLTSDLDFTENIGFTADMGFTSDLDFTEDMGFTEEDFQTEQMDYGEEDFQTEQMGYGEEDFATEELGFDEGDFSTGQMDFDDGDLLDDVDSDEFVVYGGQSRTEELTIDDLDDLLNDSPKKSRRSDPDDTFKVDFIDLD